MENKNVQYERCVCCGKMTDVPVDQHISKREFYVEGVGQLCIKCGYQLLNENQEKMHNDFGV